MSHFELQGMHDQNRPESSSISDNNTDSSNGLIEIKNIDES